MGCFGTPPSERLIDTTLPVNTSSSTPLPSRWSRGTPTNRHSRPKSSAGALNGKCWGPVRTDSGFFGERRGPPSARGAALREVTRTDRRRAVTRDCPGRHGQERRRRDSADCPSCGPGRDRHRGRDRFPPGLRSSMSAMTTSLEEAPAHRGLVSRRDRQQSCPRLHPYRLDGNIPWSQIEYVMLSGASARRSGSANVVVPLPP